MTYTQLALIGVVVAISNDLLMMRTRLILRKGFWTAYAIVIFFQLLTNAWLTNNLRTGTAVVNYSEAKITGIRIAFAPIEDLLFGFTMVLLTLTCWVSMGRATRRYGSNPRR